MDQVSGNQTAVAFMPRAGMQLSFSDEFNRGDVLNLDQNSPTWNTTFPGGTRNLPQFYEDQLYLDDNGTTLSSGRRAEADPFRIQDGALTISAAPTTAADADVIKTPYTSGMINTGQGAYDFRYGYIEMRADMPTGSGLLPAFYMVRTDNVALGEIDMIEYLSERPNYVHQTIFYSKDGVNTSMDKTVRDTIPTDLSEGYHTYGVDWQPDFTTFYIDGQVTGRMATPESLKAPMYILANMSVGASTLGGAPVSASNPWPAEFALDYIRVYQDASAFAPVSRTGTAANDTLSGGDGADTLAGGDGNDTLLGAGGNDSLSGGAGNDRLLGGLGNDTLDGGAGADKLEGGRGDDTYVMTDTGNTVVEFANAGTDTVRTSLASYALSGNVENLVYTGSSRFVGTGNSLDNVITGGSGNDVLVGGAGNDVLIGGAGHDKLSGGLGDDVLWAGSGNDTLIGAEGADTFVFRSGDSGTTFISDFQLGSDKLDLSGLGYTSLAEVQTHAAMSKQGNLVLSLGNEVVTLQKVKLGQLTERDVVLVTPAPVIPVNDAPVAAATNRVTTNEDTASIAVAINATDLDGDQLSYALKAGASPSQGSVRFDQEAGRFLYTPAAGRSGSDHFTIVVSDGNGGSVEQAVSVTINPVNDAPRPGPAPANGVVLTGTVEGDRLTGGVGHDTLDGGAGADTMLGGAGDDTYLVDSTGDVVTERGNAGTDTVRTGLDKYTLRGNVENLIYTGSDAFNGVGNGLNNVLTGGAGNDKLIGGAGHDSLTGGAGNDKLNGGTGNDVLWGGAGTNTLTGDAGADVFVFRSGESGTSFITDFQLGTDTLDLSGMGYTSFADVQANLSSTSQGFALISDAGQSIVLQHVTATQLQTADFVF